MHAFRFITRPCGCFVAPSLRTSSFALASASESPSHPLIWNHGYSGIRISFGYSAVSKASLPTCPSFAQLATTFCSSSRRPLHDCLTNLEPHRSHCGGFFAVLQELRNCSV